jgi:hypothetical protein
MSDLRKLEKKMTTMKAGTVIDYIVQRIADEGVEHGFGVPGDYAFPVGDAVDHNPNIKWIGCSNELNASYAADGYARVRGAAMLSTTYALASCQQSTESWARKPSARSSTMLSACRPTRISVCAKQCTTLSVMGFLTNSSTFRPKRPAVMP